MLTSPVLSGCFPFPDDPGNIGEPTEKEFSKFIGHSREWRKRWEAECLITHYPLLG